MAASRAALVLARQIIWEFHTNARLCLQTTLHIYNSTRREKAYLKNYFEQGQLLEQGRYGEFINHIQLSLRRNPVPLLAGAGMAAQLRPHLANVRQDDLKKALVLTSISGSLEVIELLVPHIAAQNRQKFLDDSLSVACHFQQLEIAEYLLSQGAKGTSRLLEAAVVANQPGLVQRMLAKGACPVHKLRYAAGHGQLENLKLLLAATPEKGCDKYWYIRDAACYAGCPEVLSELLLALDNRPLNYQQMASTAAAENNLVVLHYLANAQHPTYQGPALALPQEVALEACTKGHLEATAFLLDRYRLRPETLLATAACSGQPALVKLLLARAAPMEVSILNDALLKVAASTQENFPRRAMLELLIQAGATDLNSALVGAAGQCDFEAVRFLVYQGATALNEALLQVSTGSDWEAIISFLLDCGADDITGALEKYTDQVALMRSFAELLRRKGRLVLVRC